MIALQAIAIFIYASSAGICLVYVVWFVSDRKLERTTFWDCSVFAAYPSMFLFPVINTALAALAIWRFRQPRSRFGF